MDKAELQNTINVLQDTIKWFKKRIEPQDCGWMYDTIGGIKHRIKEAKQEMKKIDKTKKKTNNSISKKS